MISIWAILSFGMVGCAKQQNEKQDNTNNLQTQTQPQVSKLDYNIPKKDRKSEEIKVVEFNLGESTIQQTNGVPMPYKIQGTVGVPQKTGKYPVVWIAHGRHNGTKVDVRFDNGFSYLVEAVAKQGYIAISLDINSQYIDQYGESIHNERLEQIFQEHLKKLTEANNGIDVGYEVDLKDKVDLENMIFIGHSRAGQMMVELAQVQIESGNNSIKGIISIAPSEVTLVKKYSDIPIGFVIPEYDGDVIGLDGFRMYDTITNYKDRKSMTALVYLKGANHNFFNSILEGEGTRDKVKVINPLTKEQQRGFLVDYTIDFIDAIFNNNTKDTAFDITAPSPNQMYGYTVITKLDNPIVEKAKIIDVGSSKEVETKDVTVKIATESWIPEKDTVGAFTDPRLGEPIPVMTLSWKQKGASAMKKNFKNKDFSKHQTITFSIAPDPANELSKPDVDQAFNVAIKDSKGNESKVLLGVETTVLQYVEGEINPGDYGDGTAYPAWTNYTPIGEVRIPLSYFKGIDLTDVISLTFEFDQTDSGSLVIEDVELK